jgi:hypothetical protein
LASDVSSFSLPRALEDVLFCCCCCCCCCCCARLKAERKGRPRSERPRARSLRTITSAPLPFLLLSLQEQFYLTPQMNFSTTLRVWQANVANSSLRSRSVSSLGASLRRGAASRLSTVATGLPVRFGAAERLASDGAGRAALLVAAGLSFGAYALSDGASPARRRSV